MGIKSFVWVRSIGMATVTVKVVAVERSNKEEGAVNSVVEDVAGSLR
jgi:hypothetical protein